MHSKQADEGLQNQSVDSEVSGDDLQLILEKYQSIFERKLHCIYMHDLDGNFLEANDAALKLLGYSREEMFSLNFAALVEEDQFALALKTTDEILQTGFQPEFTEFKLKRKGGGFVWIETDGTLINRNGKPDAILGVARDITDRKMAEKALKESEANYKQIIDHAPAGIYEVNLATMKFTRVNDIMCRVTGYTREEFLSMAPADLIRLRRTRV